MGRITTRVPRVRYDVASGATLTRPDTVAVEEPLELRVAGETLTTMRTPGDDFDWALGHLLTEGLIRTSDDVQQLMHCTDVDEDGRATFNVVDATLRPGVHLLRRPRARAEATTSACGVCGSATIDAIETSLPYAVAPERPTLTPEVIVGLPDLMRQAQATFDRTGGVHAAGLFSSSGDLHILREDVGRHNAVDKVIGAFSREHEPPLADTVLVVSARASFEIVQKAAMVGIPAVVAVSAPSSLAIELAARAGLTLVAFTRPPSFSVYAGQARIVARL